jgi:hypothetical protein
MLRSSELFEAQINKLLVSKELIGPDLIAKMRNWDTPDSMLRSKAIATKFPRPIALSTCLTQNPKFKSNEE